MPTFIQGANGDSAASSSNQTATFSSANTAGNFVVVCVAWGSSAGVITSVTDTAGNVYQPAIIANQYFSFDGNAIYYCQGVKASAPGNVVTVAFSTPATFRALALAEYSGMTGGVLDNTFSSTLHGTSPADSGTITTRMPNELILVWTTIGNNGYTATTGAGFTVRVNTSVQNLILADAFVSAAGNYDCTSTFSGTQFVGVLSVAFTTAAPAAPTNTQEVSLSGAIIGTPGSYQSNGNVISNLFDANNLTRWDSPNASGDWAGIDAGAPAILTRVRLSPTGSYEDRAIGGQIQGSSSSTFASGVATLFTIGVRPLTGTLINEYAIPYSGFPYRYFRYLSATPATLSDLEFVVYNTTGVTGTSLPVTFAPAGGIYDYPTVVSLSCLTSGATIYYTKDGSTPSTGSTLYTGPFVVSTDATVKAISVCAGVSNARVTTQSYSVSGLFVSTGTPPVDANRGYRIWAINPNVMWDPVSRTWYLYGWSSDQVGIYETFIGVNCYSSPDLRNWTFKGVVLAPTPGNAQGSNVMLDRFHCLYNALNNNYVAWCRQGIGSGSFGPYKVYTAPSPTGPFTNVNNPATLDGNTTGGDLKAWLDPSTGFAYLFWTTDGNATIGVTRLNSAFTDSDGVNHVYWLAAASPFGVQSEGHGVALVNGVYFWITSTTGNWAPVESRYVSSTNPLGPWSAGTNAFQNVSVAQTPEELAIGLTPTYLNSYDSQAVGLIQIPGRGAGAVVYVGDRYDILVPGDTQSLTDSFFRYRFMLWPVTFPTSSTLSITWNNSWSFDGMFPTVAGAPTPASNLVISGGVATWTTNEVNPANVYLDTSINASFASGVTQQVVPPGLSSVPILWPGTNYRVRTVNANGSSVSPVFQASSVNFGVGASPGSTLGGAAVARKQAGQHHARMQPLPSPGAGGKSPRGVQPLPTPI